jgi:uncharacterized membrane protein (DUF373 family)
MNRLNRYLLLDICAMAIALLALTVTVAALSVSTGAQAQSNGTPSTISFSVRHSE